jgi:hypothetical protein
MPGEWHNKMESYFPPEMREVKFYCKVTGDNEPISRRADILLDNRRTIEIQHSRISNEEIVKRFEAWDKFGKDIIWLVDGNDSIECSKLSNGNHLIWFKTAWKYKSFVSKYEFILLEISGNVFRIDLKKVKCKMIELKEHKTIVDIIDVLKTDSKNIWKNWSDDDAVGTSKLTVHQQGAGNGKTYGIWKEIATNTDKETFLIITKQHSAKTVIYKELCDQIGRSEEHILNIIDKLEENTTKHYVIKYTHKISKKVNIVIIGTADSFLYNVGNVSNNGGDMFLNLLKNIIKNGPEKVNEYGFMNFGGQSVRINKSCEIWIDEAQDLPQEYLYAFTRLMRETLCDIHIVGDKLQSLEHEDNCFATIVNEGIENLPNVSVTILKPVNKNRRIKINKMDTKINSLINFDKYSLPSIEEINNEQCGDNCPIEELNEPPMYARLNEFDKTKKNEYINLLLEKVDYEVTTNSYLPENFMFIFPIMKNNELAIELETKLQEYWTEKFTNELYISKITDEYWKTFDHSKYSRYAILHKHEEGTVINTNDSVHATRLVTIRTSKGDGREVVFVLNTNENSLKKLSDSKDGLVYESYLHVALTRAKNKIYFGLQINNDEIHKRFIQGNHVAYLPKSSHKFKIADIIKQNKVGFTQLLQSHNINQENIFNQLINNKQSNKPKETVDWGYHCIKYCVYFYKFILQIVKSKDANSDFNNSHLCRILNKLSKIKITEYSVNDYYQFINKHRYCKKSCCEDNKKEFPLCVISDKIKYQQYFKTIKSTMETIQTKIRTNTLENMGIYESVILTYMIEGYTDLVSSNITPNDLYNITDFFEINSNKEKDLLKQLDNIYNIVNKILDTCESNIKWNLTKHIKFDGKTDDFKINKLNYPLIGYTDTNVTHIILKTDISSLNFWDIMMEVLYERFLIFNPESDGDKAKYKGKAVNTYIVLLEKNDYIIIDWDWDKDLLNDISQSTKEALFNHYNIPHDELLRYFNTIRTNDNKDKLWGENCSLMHGGQNKNVSTPFQYMEVQTEFNNYPEYIVNFFKSLHNDWIDGSRDKVITTCSSFIEELEKCLERACKKYFGLNKDLDTDFDFGF